MASGVTGFEGLVDPEVLGEDEGSEVAEAMKAREALLLVLEARFGGRGTSAF